MTAYFWIQLAVMAGVTYLVRMLPLVIFAKKLKTALFARFCTTFLTRCLPL